MKKILLFSFFSLFFPIGISFADFVVPPLPSSPVFDEVSLLKPEEKTTLENTILTLEKETSHQIGIAIIKTLQGRTIEEVGIVLARSWGIGQKGLDNGLLILIAPTEREMRIEVGRGLEGVMTDLMSKRIIDENFTPHFKVGNYATGLGEGIERMSPLLRGEVVALPEKKSDISMDTIEVLFVIFAMFGWGVLSILSSSKSWWLGGVVGGIVGILFAGISGAMFIGILGLIVDYILSTFTYQKIPLIKNAGASRWGNGGFGGGNSGGWGGFGGGGFGGGGASGRW